MDTGRYEQQVVAVIRRWQMHPPPYVIDDHVTDVTAPDFDHPGPIHGLAIVPEFLIHATLLAQGDGKTPLPSLAALYQRGAIQLVPDVLPWSAPLRVAWREDTQNTYTIVGLPHIVGDDDPSSVVFSLFQSERCIAAEYAFEAWPEFPKRRFEPSCYTLPFCGTTPPLTGVTDKRDNAHGANIWIEIVKVCEVVGKNAGRPDNLAKKMIRRGYVVEKRGKRNVCRLPDAIGMFPDHIRKLKKTFDENEQS
jgi:hypothetical protein